MAAKKKTTQREQREKVQRRLKSLNALSVHVLNDQANQLRRIAAALERSAEAQERSAKALADDVALRQEARASQLELQKRSVSLLEAVAPQPPDDEGREGNAN